MKLELKITVMIKNKKNIIFLLCIFCLFCVFGCGKKANNNNSIDSVQNSQKNQAQQGQQETSSVQQITKELSPEALKQVKEFLVENKANLLFVYAEYCPACREYKPIVKDLLENNYKNIELVLINVDEETELAETLELKVVPSMLLFKKDGSFVELISGSIPTVKLEEELKKLS